MKLVDTSGNELTSKNNENAQKLERQMSKKIETMLEPVMNKIKLSGAQVPQQQLMQLTSAAQQILFNRMIYNLLKKLAWMIWMISSLRTTLKNSLLLSKPGKMVDSEELRRQMQENNNPDEN